MINARAEETELCFLYNSFRCFCPFVPVVYDLFWLNEREKTYTSEVDLGG